MKYQIGKLFVWVSMGICFAALIAYPLHAADQTATKNATDQKAINVADQAASPKKVVSEEIKPEAISLQSGFCYVGVLTLGRQGESDGKVLTSGSECILLEDGRPLSSPHANHEEIRKIGKGRYNHWTETMILFSASDNTDPRTNGRRYTLVSEGVAKK